jgi:OOP family OmpA-OmpF porin
VEILKRNPDLIIEIAGHTDSQGGDDYNQGLSERRAQAVLDYFVSHGVNPGNITVRGYGESEPVADNSTREGRAANRRVELRQR